LALVAPFFLDLLVAVPDEEEEDEEACKPES